MDKAWRKYEQLRREIEQDWAIEEPDWAYSILESRDLLDELGIKESTKPYKLWSKSRLIRKKGLNHETK